MAKIRPDFSFDREGRPLSAWLLDFVSEDAPTRLKAGDVLQGMWYGVPYATTDLDDLDWAEHESRPGQFDRFAAAVREAVAASGFPTAAFVRRLIIADMLKAHQWYRFRRKSRERAVQECDEVAETIVRRLTDAGDAIDRAEDNRRLAVAYSPRLDGRDDPKRLQEMHLVEMTLHLVIQALDTALLADRPGLRAWFDLGAIARIGPPAVEFAPLLLDDLDADCPFRSAAALGSIGRDDPAVVAALLGRLRSGTPAMQRRVAECLYHAGPALAGRVDEAVAILIELTRQDCGRNFYVASALGSVGRDREDALGRLLEMASPLSSLRITEPSVLNHGEAGAMVDRGLAIAALRFFRMHAGRIVPILIEAIDSFEEFDPDHGPGYGGGDHWRIGQTLAAFGPDAGPAVPRLTAYLEAWLRRPESERHYPRVIFEVLKSIGPAANAALPVLETFRSEFGDEEDRLLPENPLDAAILAIRGRS